MEEESIPKIMPPFYGHYDFQVVQSATWACYISQTASLTASCFARSPCPIQGKAILSPSRYLFSSPSTGLHEEGLGLLACRSRHDSLPCSFTIRGRAVIGTEGHQGNR